MVPPFQTFFLSFYNFTSCTPNPTHALVPVHCLCSSSQRIKRKYKNKTIPKKNISSWKLWYVTRYHPVYPFVYTFLLANVHCHESLVWFRASGICYNSVFSPGRLSNVLSLPCVREILQLWICRAGSFTHSSSYRWCRCWGGPAQSPGSGPG